MKHPFLTCTMLAASLMGAAQANAADLYAPSGWSALSSDRIAHKPGDILTVLVYENATASDSAISSANKSSSLSGQISAGPTFSEAGSLSLNNGSDDHGSTQRSGAMVAQISAVVDDVLPSGDLHIRGSQILNINGERANIRINGRVRLADVSASNVVLSSRIADAHIDFDGVGFVSRSAKPGVITRVLQWLGIP